MVVSLLHVVPALRRLAGETPLIGCPLSPGLLAGWMVLTVPRPPLPPVAPHVLTTATPPGCAVIVAEQNGARPR
jgi:hypothetical protein